MALSHLDKYADILPHLATASGGGGSMAIGGAITGATDGSILFVGAGGLLAQSASLTWDNVDSQLVLGAGTVGKPSLIFGDDTTGMYSSGFNTLGWAISGIAAMKLGGAGPDSDQTLAIGRCLIDSRLTDRMILSHRDQSITSAYSLSQTAGGASTLNSVTGQNVGLATGGSTRWYVEGSALAWTPGTDGGAGADLGATANRIRNVFLGSYMEMSEMTAPAAPAVNKARFFCEDNGAGKTRIMAIFNTGAAVQIAIEP
jgi:hypothetical protein